MCPVTRRYQHKRHVSARSWEEVQQSSNAASVTESRGKLRSSRVTLGKISLPWRDATCGFIRGVRRVRLYVYTVYMQDCFHWKDGEGALKVFTLSWPLTVIPMQLLFSFSERVYQSPLFYLNAAWPRLEAGNLARGYDAVTVIGTNVYGFRVSVARMEKRGRSNAWSVERFQPGFSLRAVTRFWWTLTSLKARSYLLLITREHTYARRSPRVSCVPGFFFVFFLARRFRNHVRVQYRRTTVGGTVYCLRYSMNKLTLCLKSHTYTLLRSAVEDWR